MSGADEYAFARIAMARAVVAVLTARAPRPMQVQWDVSRYPEFAHGKRLDIGPSVTVAEVGDDGVSVTLRARKSGVAVDVRHRNGFTTVPSYPADMLAADIVGFVRTTMAPKPPLKPFLESKE